MKRRGLPDKVLRKKSPQIEHPTDLIPIQDGFFTYMQIDKIIVPENQVRKHFDASRLQELAQSIKNNGIINPLTVREDKGKTYLISGERRYRACVELGIQYIPVIYTNKKPDILSLIENLQREDLTPFEEAYGYFSIKNKHSLTLSTLAGLIGKDHKYISRVMRLVELPERIKKEFVTSRISKELLIRISQIHSSNEQLRVWDILKCGDFTVREANKYFKKRPTKKTASTTNKRLVRYVSSLKREIGSLQPARLPRGDIKSLAALLTDLRQLVIQLEQKLDNSVSQVNISDSERREIG